MGVYTRPDSPYYWLLLERDKGRAIRQSTKIPKDAPTTEQRRDNKRLAEQLYHDAMHGLARKAHRLPSDKEEPITFQAFSEWYEHHVMNQHKGKEREEYALKRLRAHFKNMALEDIDREQTTEYRTARLAMNVAARTVNREVALLKSMLVAAVPKYLTVSPIYGMATLKVVKPKRRLMTPSEEAKLLRALAIDDRALFLIGLDSLVRQSDILDIRWADVNLTNQTVYIGDPKDPKQSEPYTAPLSRRVVSLLKKLKKGATTPYVFARRRRAKTERDRRGTVRQLLEYACKKAGVVYGRKKGGITFHWSTRRTGATRMLRKNVPLAAVQKLGHWSDPDTVLSIYNEAFDEDVRKAVEVSSRRRRKRRD